MSPLTTDNRDMVEIETELRARIDVQRAAIERLERENAQLVDENCGLRSLLEGEPVAPCGDAALTLRLVANH